MKALDGGHLLSFLRYLDAIADTDAVAVHGERGEEQEHEPAPKRGESIELDSRGVKQVQECEVAALLQPTGADKAGNAREVGTRAHRHEGEHHPREGGGPRASRSQEADTPIEFEPQFHDALQWIREHLGQSVQAKRKIAFSNTKNAEQIWDQLFDKL
jgi:hypothetical protein